MNFAIDESFFLDFVNQIKNYKTAYDFLSKISQASLYELCRARPETGAMATAIRLKKLIRPAGLYRSLSFRRKRRAR